MLPQLSTLVNRALLSISFTSATSMEGYHKLTAQVASEHALMYAYPLLAYRDKYTSLAPLIGINALGHARLLATSRARSTVKPNADTIYSTALYDVSHNDLYIDLPQVPADQFALCSFHDLYGNNFAILGREDFNEIHSFYLTPAAATNAPTESGRTRIASPTTFGILMIRWLFKNDNLNTIHSLQDATIVKPVPRQVNAQTDDTCYGPRLSSVNWTNGDQSSAGSALHLLRQIGVVNTPGRLAGTTVQEVLKTSGFCARNQILSGVDLEVADRNVLAELKSNGQSWLEKRNNGWSVIHNDMAGDFGNNYGLRAQVAFTGYLMLRSPAALYPSWSGDSYGPALEGEVLELGVRESYVYTFSGKPPLGKLGFWSLTVYDADGYLIQNARNAFALGDRSNITYASGGLVYGSASFADIDKPFQLLVQAADVPPPDNWINNWLPGPNGGGRITALLRFFDAAEELLHGRYQFPVVTKQECIVNLEE